MNRYGRPSHVGGASATKASAHTVCQKCLKKGHYSYECKAPSQDRPYISRPSRSQQLLNPKLKPKLANIAPDPSLQEKAVAPPRPGDAHAHALQRKRSVDDMDNYPTSRKRTRSGSVSSYSSASVATISTRSPSPDTRPRRTSPHGHHESPKSAMDGHASGGARDKRRRGSSPVSPSEGSSRHGRERNTRLRRSSTSPVQRGRRRSRSATSDSDSASGHNPRGVADYSRRVDPDDRPKRDLRGGRDAAGYSPQHDPDREMKDVPNFDSRPRSPSPYSRRVALTQGTLK